ncbi:hypothetical protein Taro_019355 [Colocasia esculenta]|uniref:Sec-independent protein translocase protein TatB n=1 Tax=Colocasia esculenta TaxID=4460 RepID=A0A843UT93_COLES|nr:hypothetical protein [Colocasia esculenta]
MFGLSYGEIFLLLGATAALIGPKDLPLIARTAGRLAGRAIGYVQMARGHFDNVMQQGQVSQVHKELQDTIAQLEAIRYEIRSISLVNPGPLTRRLDNIEPKPNDGNSISQRIDEERKPTTSVKDYSSLTTGLTNIHSQATAYAKLAESESISPRPSRMTPQIPTSPRRRLQLHIDAFVSHSADITYKHWVRDGGTPLLPRRRLGG